MYASRFTAAAAVVAAVAALVASVGVVVVRAPASLTGSVAVSGLVAFAFAANSLQSVRTTGAPSFASATVATVLGVWLAVSPLVYDAGFVAVALVQFAGLLVAACSAQAALSVVETALIGDRRGPTGGGDAGGAPEGLLGLGDE